MKSVLDNHDISNKKIAILATDGFEESELLEPKNKLTEMGATVDVVSVKSGQIKAWKDKDWGQKVKVDKVLADVEAADYDALILPGGVMNPDSLRTEKEAIDFIKEFNQLQKPIAAICHGPWTLIEAQVVKGRVMTSYPSLATDLKNAGADWVDKELVESKGVITSRNPKDLPVFINAIADVLQTYKERSSH